jgi:DNA processing protein
LAVDWDRETAALVCNALPNLSPRTFLRLVERLGNGLGHVLSAGEGELAGELALPPRSVDCVLHWKDHVDPEKEFLALERFGGRFISQFSPDYPAILRSLEDPPIGFYLAGKDIARARSVAIVGSRTCTFAGETLAQNLARQLSELGYIVASGMAKGIDLAAHVGSLAAHGHTVAVLAGALDQIYPPENADLYRRIREEGTLFSEFPFSQTIQRQNFPIRNRIITGLSAATVVVESPLIGGSMLSARSARRQRRPLFAVPGRLTDPRSAGCLKLIREGAHLFTGVEDIFAVIGTAPRASQLQLSLDPEQGQAPAREHNFSAAERIVWEHLVQLGRATADELAAAADLDVLNCAQILQNLRIGGAVTRDPSGEFTAA